MVVEHNARMGDQTDMAAHRRIDDVERRLDDHFSMIEALELSIKDNTSSLAKNTELAQDIANNTKELVDLFRGAKAFRKFLFWTSPAVAIFYGAYQWLINIK